MTHYDRVKHAFMRGVGGAFIPATETEDIDRLKAEGYEIVIIPGVPVVKVLNPEYKGR